MNRIIISLDEELLKQIDERRSLYGTPRAEFIRRCVLDKLGENAPRVGIKEKRIKEAKKPLRAINPITDIGAGGGTLCKHGSMKGLCKHGC